MLRVVKIFGVVGTILVLAGCELPFLPGDEPDDEATYDVTLEVTSEDFDEASIIWTIGDDTGGLVHSVPWE